jgi:hypothetical protein
MNNWKISSEIHEIKTRIFFKFFLKFLSFSSIFLGLKNYMK